MPLLKTVREEARGNMKLGGGDWGEEVRFCCGRFRNEVANRGALQIQGLAVAGGHVV